VFARLADLDLDLREVRSFAQLEQAMGEITPSVIAVEVQLDQLAKAIATIHRAKAGSRAAVIAMPDPEVEPWTTSLYEAGTDLIFRSMLDRAKAATLIRGRVRLDRESHRNQDELSLRRQVWGRLPWKRHASGGSR
jgi:hypothetical protein